jgi:putative ABC transport system permease protein
MPGRLESMLFALRSHKAIACMIVLDVALTCAIACNATQVIASRWRLLRQPTGVEDARLVVVRTTLLGDPEVQRFQRDRDLLALRALAGVEAVSEVGSMPYMDDLALSVSSSPPGRDGGNGMDVSVYFGTPGHLRVLGARLLAGRDFGDETYVPFANGAGTAGAPTALVSESVARRLYGNAPAIGRSLYMDDGRVVTVVGVVADLLRPHPSLADADGNHDTIVLPMIPDGTSASYVLRTSAAADGDRVARQAGMALDRLGGDRIVDAVQPFVEMQREFLEKDRTQLGLLGLGLAGLLAVTLVGLSGLSSYWVRQRTRSIGIRRALGATRGDVLRHFLLENLVVVGLGALAGVAVALAVGRVVARDFAIPALSPGPVLAAALLVCALGQLAVLRAALSASRIPPRTAMGA